VVVKNLTAKALSFSSGTLTDALLSISSSSLTDLQFSSVELSASVLEVTSTQITSASYAVTFSSSPSTGGTVQRWTNNQIATTVTGTYAVYYASSGFTSSTLQMTDNVIKTPNSASSYCLLIDQTAGKLSIDGTNQFLYGGISIAYTDTTQYPQSLIFRNSYFVAPFSISVSVGDLLDSMLEVSNSTISSSFGITATGTLTRCSIKILSSSFSTAVGFSSFTLVDSTISIASSSLIALQFSSVELRKSVLEVTSTQITSTFFFFFTSSMSRIYAPNNWGGASRGCVDGGERSPFALSRKTRKPTSLSRSLDHICCSDVIRGVGSISNSDGNSFLSSASATHSQKM
jgi:hypothetical protein